MKWLWESGNPAFGFPLSHGRREPELRECGNRAGDFQGLVGSEENLHLVFLSLSTARHFRSLFAAHAIFLCQISANSFCFAFCIAMAAWVSLCASAMRSSFSTVRSSFRNPAIPGK